MAVLTSFDPFRDIERLTDAMLSRTSGGPRVVPADAFRRAGDFYVSFDLPGVDADTIELTVEKNVLSVSAERRWDRKDDDKVILAERPQGRFARQLYLSDNLDTDNIEANYDQGVLTLRIPVSERAKPRRVQVSSHGREQAIDTTTN